MMLRIDDVRFMDYWFSWFVGFVDGEGSFQILRKSGTFLRSSYRCDFTLRLRDDDRIILEEIQGMLGIGAIYDVPVYPSDIPNARPMSRFHVGALNGCVELVKIFERYPLRAKKKRDFSIWRSAVIELQKPIAYRNADLLEYYFNKIRHVRKYDKQPELEKPVIVDTQLLIEF